MGFAEKKVELFQIVANADEATTSKLIEFAYSIQGQQQPSAKTISEYEKRSEDVLASGEAGITKEESLQLLRTLIK
jgi:hypothetical protein